MPPKKGKQAAAAEPEEEEDLTPQDLVEKGASYGRYFDATFGEPAASGRHIVTNLGIGQNGLAALSDDEVIERVLDDLDRVYNGDARRTYVQHRVQNWSAEPSRGVFSDDSPGVEPHYDVYAEPIDGRLYIAGEFAI